MLQILHIPQRSAAADLLAFEAQSAGLALACVFSSSDEFEADIIRERRAAGIYGPRRHRRLVTAAGIAAALTILFVVIAI